MGTLPYDLQQTFVSLFFASFFLLVRLRILGNWNWGYWETDATTGVQEVETERSCIWPLFQVSKRPLKSEGFP